ncbi:hypothetical protein GOBAR_DD11617 [Gossypium barbadense]|nr:hypothetical protein GOBAR_DD11617 [Gossypium barbadense]
MIPEKNLGSVGKLRNQSKKFRKGTVIDFPQNQRGHNTCLWSSFSLFERFPEFVPKNHPNVESGFFPMFPKDLGNCLFQLILQVEQILSFGNNLYKADINCPVVLDCKELKNETPQYNYTVANSLRRSRHWVVVGNVPNPFTILCSFPWNWTSYVKIF